MVPPGVGQANATQLSRLAGNGTIIHGYEAAVVTGVPPQLMLIGAQKAATTSIFDLLHDAGLVCGRDVSSLDPGAPKGRQKEAHFFDADPDAWGANGGDNSGHNYIGWYTAPNCSAYLDATPNYLFDNDSPLRMVKVMPSDWVLSVKMVAVLREPIARDLSVYNMMKASWWEHKDSDHTTLGSISQILCGKFSHWIFPTYKEAVDCKVDQWYENCDPDRHLGVNNATTDGLRDAYHKCGYYSTKSNSANRLTNGMYFAQLSNYLDHFHRSHVMLLNFDSLVADQPAYINHIVKFYGLPTHANPGLLPTANSEMFPGKVKKITCDSRDALYAIYQPFNNALADLIGSTKDDAPNVEPRFSRFKEPACDDSEVLWASAQGSSDSSSGMKLATVPALGEDDVSRRRGWHDVHGVALAPSKA